MTPPAGASERILRMLRDRYPNAVLIEEIARAAGISEWARRIRELRRDGWQIKYVASPKAYRLAAATKVPRLTMGAAVSARQRYRILARDHSRCRRCGRTPEDRVKLVVDHIIPQDWGGTSEDGNLWVLCEECNLGKKSWQSDVDASAMTRVLQERSGKNRLRRFFEIRANQVVMKEELQIVAGSGEYARRIRELRQGERMKILSHLEDKSLKPGEYRYTPG